MKILNKHPLNLHFFNRYISLIKETGKIKLATQVISSITAIAIWYGLAYNNLFWLLGWWTWVLAAPFAIFSTLVIEIGLRVFLPYGVRVFLYKRKEGADLTMSIFIVPICLALLVASGWTSFKGSKNVVVAVASKPELKTTTKIDSIYQYNLQKNIQSFVSDSVAIASTYNKQIKAVSTKFDTKIISLLNESEKYQQRANKAKGKGNKDWLIVLRDRATSKADNYTFQKDSINADLEQMKGNRLLVLIENRQGGRIEADTTYKAVTGKIQAINKAAILENDNQINSYGLGLGWVTVVCLLLFISLTIMEEVHKKGSKIEETPIFSQYEFLPSVSSRFFHFLESKWLEVAHGKLDKWENNLKAPTPPREEPPIYFVEEQEQKRIEVKKEIPPIEESKEENKWITILGETLGEQDFKDLEINKNNENLSSQNDDDKRVVITGFLPKTSNFKAYKENTPSNDLTNTMLSNKALKENNKILAGDSVCAFKDCNNHFTKKNYRHRFCSPDCRIADWEQQTGQGFGRNKNKKQ